MTKRMEIETNAFILLMKRYEFLGEGRASEQKHTRKQTIQSG